MKLVGGDPCLDFVNTVGGRAAGPADVSVVSGDKLAGYADLVAWARHAGLVSGPRARELGRLGERRPADAARVVARAVRLREALHRVLRASMAGARPAAPDLDLLNDELAAVRGRERLTAVPGGLRWESPGLSGAPLESVLWPVCRAASVFLTRGDLSRLRECGGDGCGWLFLDRSRNRTRQWCRMEDCGNVSKVRRFRRKRRPRGGPAG
jgi:predicted RNA-binding Zn ribbon-like protein